MCVRYAMFRVIAAAYIGGIECTNTPHPHAYSHMILSQRADGLKIYTPIRAFMALCNVRGRGNLGLSKI